MSLIFSMHLSSPCNLKINLRMSTAYSNFCTTRSRWYTFLTISINDGRLLDFSSSMSLQKNENLINVILCIPNKKETNFYVFKNSQFNKHVQISKHDTVFFLSAFVVQFQIQNLREITRPMRKDMMNYSDGPFSIIVNIWSCKLNPWKHFFH